MSHSYSVTLSHEQIDFLLNLIEVPGASEPVRVLRQTLQEAPEIVEHKVVKNGVHWKITPKPDGREISIVTPHPGYCSRITIK